MVARYNPKRLRAIVGNGIYKNIGIFVETGTLLGKYTEVAARFFRECHTVELSASLYEEAKRRLSECQNITHHLGDSADILPVLACTIEEPVFFYLDAHYSCDAPGTAWSEFPLWSELQAIAKRPYADIVVVDDVHAFGKPATKFREKERGERHWPHVNKRSILAELGHHRIARSEVIGDGFVVWMRAHVA